MDRHIQAVVSITPYMWRRFHTKSVLSDRLLDMMVAEGDKVVCYLQVRGTHQGELIGIPATGKSIAITSTEVFRLADGKIAEQWVAVDNLGCCSSSAW